MQERRLGSRYVLVELLGRGAMARVYRARVDGGTSPDVAVKLLRDDLTADPTLVSRFLQEGRVLKSIRHVNVVGILDLVAEGEDLGIVMDLVEAGDLRRTVPTPCPVRSALRIAAEIADGLAAVHAAGVTHRDLKPENVLMAEQPDGLLRPCLTDFGIARIAEASTSRASGLIGTPGYLAPEVAHGKPATSAADVYALGVIVYELCAGHAPFVADDAMALIRAHAVDDAPRPEQLPEPVWHIVRRLLAKNPAERPTAKYAAQLLRQASSSLAPGDCRTWLPGDAATQAPALPRLDTMAPTPTLPGPPAITPPRSQRHGLLRGRRQWP